MQTLHATPRQPDPVHGAFGGVLLPWVSAAAAALLFYGLVSGVLRVARRLPAGRDGAHHVHPRAVGMAVDDGLCVDRASRASGAGFRHPLADVSAKAAAPIGAAFTLLALLTGSLWGKPMWGT